MLIQNISRLDNQCLGKIMTFLATREDLKAYAFLCKKIYQALGEERRQVREFAIPPSLHPSSDNTLRVCRKFFNLRELDISQTTIRNEGLIHISRLSLRILNCSNCNWIDSDGLIHLPKTIENLNLSGCFIRNVGLSHLAQMTSLRILNISDTSVGNNNGLSHLQQLPLQLLDLSSCVEITDAELFFLSPTLTYLDLSFCGITDTGIIHLKNLPLQTLILPHTGITNTGLSYLPSTLNHLNVVDCPVTDVSIPFLLPARLQNLHFSYYALVNSFTQMQDLRRLQKVLQNHNFPSSLITSIDFRPEATEEDPLTRIVFSHLSSITYSVSDPEETGSVTPLEGLDSLSFLDDAEEEQEVEEHQFSEPLLEHSKVFIYTNIS